MCYCTVSLPISDDWPPLLTVIITTSKIFKVGLNEHKSITLTYSHTTYLSDCHGHSLFDTHHH